jgi:hypothetical protein
MNDETKAVFAAVLADWGDDLPELVAEWRAGGEEDFIRDFADQLRADLEESYSSWQNDADGRLLTLACSLLLDRVNWPEVARQLVARAENPITEPLLIKRNQS